MLRNFEKLFPRSHLKVMVFRTELYNIYMIYNHKIKNDIRLVSITPLINLI